MGLITLLGLIAGALTVISFIPQIIKIYHTKSSKDLSVYMVILFLTGSILWLIYGILIRALAVIVTNACLIFLVSIIIILKRIYR